MLEEYYGGIVHFYNPTIGGENIIIEYDMEGHGVYERCNSKGFKSSDLTDGDWEHLYSEWNDNGIHEGVENLIEIYSEYFGSELKFMVL